MIEAVTSFRRRDRVRSSGTGTGPESVLLLQASYYVATGVWPLIGERSFQAVTGPKRDFWLVKTVGVIVAAIGAVLGMAVNKRRVTPEIRTLAVATAAGLAAIDFHYVHRGRISPVYALDGGINAALALVILSRAYAVGQSAHG